MKNNLKELQHTLQHITESISNEYLIDLYLPKYKYATGVDLSNRKKLIENTITIYLKYHEDFNKQRIKLIYDDLLEIVKSDKVIFFEDTFIFMELYKILFHIHSTFNAENLLLDPKYPYGFGKIQSNKRDINRFRKKERDNVVGDFKLINRKESRLKYWLLSLFHHNHVNKHSLVNFFLHSFLLADIEKIKVLRDNQEVSKLILEDMEYFLMQKTTIGAVLKSLGILLYFELTKTLEIHGTQTEIHIQNIMDKLFNDEVSLAEVKKRIILKSSLGFFPIFGASKQFHLKSNDENFIKQKLFNEIRTFYQIDKSHFNLFFNNYMENPHTQYLQKYPEELFRINPKYSS